MVATEETEAPRPWVTLTPGYRAQPHNLSTYAGVPPTVFKGCSPCVSQTPDWVGRNVAGDGTWNFWVCPIKGRLGPQFLFWQLNEWYMTIVSLIWGSINTGGKAHWSSKNRKLQDPNFKIPTKWGHHDTPDQVRPLLGTEYTVPLLARP
jgi:hypothetical protein